MIATVVAIVVLLAFVVGMVAVMFEVGGWAAVMGVPVIAFVVLWAVITLAA